MRHSKTLLAILGLFVVTTIGTTAVSAQPEEEPEVEIEPEVEGCCRRR
jgi:hypothetical protein